MSQVNRRTFLSGATAMLAAAPRPLAASPDPVSEVTAGPGEAQLLPEEYGPTPVWAYDGVVPGAGLRVKQGARIVRRLENALPQATTVHWHGIRIDNAMDGAAGLTQDPVAPGDGFDYDFTVPDAGTFWFHPHRNTLEQVSRGLTAPLIVEEPEPPEIDAELVLTVNDWRLGQDGQIVEDFDNLFDRSHAGRIGNFLTVNGVGELEHTARQGERLRLRLINAASGRILTLGAVGLEGWTMALDGMPLQTPEPFREIVLGPAQRADLLLDVTETAGETAFLTSVERDGTYALAAFPVLPGSGGARRPAPDPLPPNPVSEPEKAAARRVPLVMEGGAMGGMIGAQMPGRGMMGMREMAAEGMVWAFNGVAGMPETPLAEAALGETLILALRNDTAFPHAMHLHGHHFREVAEAGRGPLRDTILVGARETREIAFAADNPGDWMLHCHMLAHQDAGMMSWLRVS